jgi:sigma-54 dependent transcriptional regulator, acetoin dehydrogenase operon transcriptional activator AcoR
VILGEGSFGFLKEPWNHENCPLGTALELREEKRMSIYQKYEEYLNRGFFAETYGKIEIKTKRELMENLQIDQECVRGIFQTGMKAACEENQVYYFPVLCKLKVEAIMLLFAKRNAEKEFNSSIHFLEKAAELGCKWVGESIEHELIKREYQLTKIEITKLFSTVTEPLCLIDREGSILEINVQMASMIQKNAASLVGETVSQLFPQNSWDVVKKTIRKEEAILKMIHLNEEFLAVIQPIMMKREIISYLILLKPNKTSTEQKSRGLYTFAEIKGVSKSLQLAINAAKRVAQGDATIMLRGESGTGKEMFAQSIHHESNRKSQPFIAINCAAIPENLLESELFGYEKGAFTGADKSKPGRFELANQGTLFLDEIGDMPLYLQAKILRVIQEKTIERIGSSRSIEIDVRIITATHQNLENLVHKGRFREDLYYRISVIPINIPPLRERKEDLLILIEHYMREFSSMLNRLPKRLSDAVVHKLLDYHWPGNIRELQNVVRHFMEMETGEAVTMNSLPPFLSYSVSSDTSFIEGPKGAVVSHKQDKNEILRLLDQYGRDTNGKKKVAADLGISVATLYRQLKKLRLS